MKYHILNTFAGPFAVLENSRGEVRTSWLTSGIELKLKRARQDPSLQPKLVASLTRYFNGEDVNFLTVEIPESTTFFNRCWEACRQIPRGETISYAELASRAGSPGGARAAGQAMRKNRMPVVVPCHRVIGSGGRLHGYGGSCDSSGTQLAIKRALLLLEGALSSIADEPDAISPIADDMIASAV